MDWRLLTNMELVFGRVGLLYVTQAMAYHYLD